MPDRITAVLFQHLNAIQYASFAETGSNPGGGFRKNGECLTQKTRKTQRNTKINKTVSFVLFVVKIVFLCVPYSKTHYERSKAAQ
jgi:hypothetical protein